MKKTFITAALAAAPLLTTTLAHADTGNVSIDGSVAARCLFTVNTATISLGEIADSNALLVTGNVDSHSAQLTGWCNGAASTMTAKATSLRTVASAPSGFSNQVDFTATASEGNVSAVDSNSTDNLAGPSGNVGIFSGNITVTLTNSATHGGPTSKLVAGDYTGTVLVTLTPHV